MNDIIVSVLSNGQVSLTTNKIGYNGENKARNIIIKLEKYIPDGTAVLEINQHNKKYFLSLDEQEQTFVLPIYESLLAYSEIEMQFRLIKDENVIIKSEIFKFEIDDSINAIQKTIPEEYTDWFLEVSNKLNNLEQNTATKAEIADFIKKDVAELDNFYDKTTIDDKVQNIDEKIKELEDKGVKFYTLKHVYTASQFFDNSVNIEQEDYKILNELGKDFKAGKTVAAIIKITHISDKEYPTIFFFSYYNNENNRLNGTSNYRNFGEYNTSAGYYSYTANVYLTYEDENLENIRNASITFTQKNVPKLTYLESNYARKTDIAKVYKVKGSVDTYADLADKEATATVGDVWDVKETGKNYVWTDEKTWDDIGGTVDLSDYYDKTQTDDKIDEETRDLLQGLSRELKTPDESGFSAQTIVNVKNKSGATETVMEIDNLDITTDVPTNSVLGTLKGQDLEDRLKALEDGGGTGGGTPIYYFDGNVDSEENKAMFDEIVARINDDKKFQLWVNYGNDKVLCTTYFYNEYYQGYVFVFRRLNGSSDSNYGIEYFNSGFNSITFKNNRRIVKEDYKKNMYGVDTTNKLVAKDNTKQWTPTTDYGLVHKKYVDDAITTAITGALEADY